MCYSICVPTNKWVIIHEVVETFRSNCKTANNLARHNFFLIVCYGTLFTQVDNAIRKHLRVNAKILVVAKLSQNSIRNSSDTFKRIRV